MRSRLACLDAAPRAWSKRKLRWHKSLRVCGSHAKVALFCRYAFQPHRIAVWIYLQAVLLLWKGVAFYGPPDKTYQTRISSCSFSRLTPMTEGTFFRWRGAQSWPWL